MKHNGTQGTYHSVPQNVQVDDTEDAKKAPTHESVIENGQNVKSSPTPSKEIQEDCTEDEKKPMSPLRKFCFVLSLLQCVLFIVAFGWLIPCKIPRHTDKGQFSHNWELNFYNEEVATSLAITDNAHKPVAVVYGFVSLSNVSVYRVRALNAFDGSNLWETYVLNKPENIVCNGIDVNSDKVPDCIVTDATGKMFSISARDGKVIWYMHDHHDRIEAKSVSTPIMGKSCPDGNTPYIYAAVQGVSGTYHFVTVSGMTGLIDEIYNLPDCEVIPSGLMLRDHKVEVGETDPSQDVVLTCTNKAGKSIIYYANTNEFCKNATTESANTMFLKLAIIDSKNLISMNLLKSNEGDILILLTDDGKFKVYIEEMEVADRVSADNSQMLKGMIVGRFTNNSLSNVALLSSSDSTKSDSLILLDKTNSRSLRVIPIENGTATSVFTVHKAHNPLDTILLRVTEEVNDDFSSDNSTEISPRLKYIQEKFIILDCWETELFRTVSGDTVTVNCDMSDCKSNAITINQNAILADVDNDGVDELVHYITKTNPSLPVQFVTIKLTRLSDPQTTKSCSSCSC